MAPVSTPTTDPVAAAADAAQVAAEAHLAACWAHLHEEGPQPEDMAAPFCGCPTCEVREVLHAAYPHLQAMWDADLRAAGINLPDFPCETIPTSAKPVYTGSVGPVERPGHDDRSTP